MPLEIVQLLCRSDNYAVLLHDGGKTVVVDTPDGAVIDRELTRRGWTLDQILTTHHHQDHTAGHDQLKAKYRCEVVAPAAEAAAIPGVDRTVKEGDVIDVLGRATQVIETPGHTKGHVTFHIPDERIAFAGDTLFTLGCGRILEGDAAMMWHSLQKLAALPPETMIYSGHEYTESNARFALTIEPGNTRLAARAAEIKAARARGEATVPSSLSDELQTNPFLRAAEPAIRQLLGMERAPDTEVFGEIRARKDRF